MTSSFFDPEDIDEADLVAAHRLPVWNSGEKFR